MKQLGLYFLIISFITQGCISDGVEHKKDYTNSNRDIELSDSLTGDKQQAQYYFELGLKKAALDKDSIGDWKGAIDDLTKAIEIQPNFLKAYHYRAIIYSDLQNYDRAMIDINSAITLDKNHKESYFVRAGLFVLKKEYDKAIDDLSFVIQIDSTNGKAYERRGYLKIEIGNKEEGCKDLGQARDLGYMIGNTEGDKYLCN